MINNVGTIQPMSPLCNSGNNFDAPFSQQQQQNCLACEFPIAMSNNVLSNNNNNNNGRQKLCQACRKFFYRHSMKSHERLEMAPCMCKFKTSVTPNNSGGGSSTPPMFNNCGDVEMSPSSSPSPFVGDQQQSSSTSRSHSICKSCRYRRCLQAGLTDDCSNKTMSSNEPTYSPQQNFNFTIKMEKDDYYSGDDSDEILIATAIGNNDSFSPQISHNSAYENNNDEGSGTMANLDVSQLPCSVCGWSATGVHFGAVTCDACKAFYGRFARRLSGSGNGGSGAVLASLTATNSCCLTGGKCFDNGSSLHASRVSQNRMRCASCRISKCIAVGMSPYGSVAGRRSQAQKKAITEAVKEFYRGSLPASGIAKAQSPPVSIISTSQSPAQPSFFSETSTAAMPSPSLNYFQQPVYKPNNTFQPINNERSMPNSSPPNEQTKAIAVVAPSVFSKYSELVDAIRNKRNLDVGSSSQQLIWLYNSGSVFIDLKQLETGGFTQLPVEIDPQHLFERFVANPLPPVPYSNQLSLDSNSRTEWLIGKVVSAVKILSKMSEIRCHINDAMDALEIWQATMDNFVLCFKCALQFVRNLPGFDWLQNVADRILLFSNSLICIFVLQLSVDYDPVNDQVNVFNLDNESVQIAKNKNVIFAKAAPPMREAGILLKTANINVAEFGLIAGLLFFNDQVNGLVETAKVKLIADDYWLALEMLSCQSSNGNVEAAKRRIETISQHVRYYSFFTQHFLRLMDTCRHVYPSVVGIEPLLEEVTQQMARIHMGSPTKSEDRSTPPGTSENRSTPVVTINSNEFREFPVDI